MGIGQILTMPLFFASNAIYPITIMPQWLKYVSEFNPLTYQVDALRSLMIEGSTSIYGLGFDLTAMLVGTAVLIIICAHLYPKTIN